MDHSMWLQNRTLAHAINGKTPYEMRHKTKPNLAGIQEFGAAAYVKDLKAGKLDARAKVSHIVGYDSESKGYRIYWPEKRSITVERNVVFNQDNIHTSKETAIIHGETQSEGEINKSSRPPRIMSTKSKNLKMKNRMINRLKNQYQNLTQVINPQTSLHSQLKTIPKMSPTQKHPKMTNTVAEKKPGHHQEPSKQ